MSPEHREDMWGVVLAGGKSERMGTDKALLKYEGRTMIERAVEVLAKVFGNRVIVASGSAGRFVGLDLPRVIEDAAPGAGPMGGLLAALEGLRGAPVFLAACDMPRLDPVPICEQIREWGAQDADALVPVAAGRIQPLHAIYSPACAAAARTLIESGRRRMQDLVRAVRTRFWTVPAEWEIAFENVNTPADWARISDRKDA